MSGKKITYTVHWMTCESCVFLITETLKEQTKNTKNIHVSLSEKTVTVEYDWNTSYNADDTEHTFNTLLNPHGYRVSQYSPDTAEATDAPDHMTKTLKNVREYIRAMFFACCFVGVFLMLQSSGVSSFSRWEEKSPLFMLILGGVASVSTCLAVVGGLALAVGTAYTQQTSSWKPIAQFHLGRILAFVWGWAILWFVWGWLQISAQTTAVLNFAVACVMLLLWLQQLGVHGSALTVSWSLASGIKKYMSGVRWNRFAAAAWIFTFFLPCWFTQSAQIMALAAGSWRQWAIILWSFVIGTLPVLLFLSSSWKILERSSRSGVFFKTIGFLLVLLAFYNITNILTLRGILS